MTLPTITEAPAAPNRSTMTDAEFSAAADAFTAWWVTQPGEYNAFAPALVAAAAVANYSASSTSSVAIGTGSKSFTIETGKQFVIGQEIKVTSTADITKFMQGVVTAHNASTGALTLTVTLTGGAGTLASWTIGLAGPKGDPGANGNDGINYTLNIQTFTLSGTWTKPSIGTFADIEIWAPGGGAGSGSKQAGGSCGGGAGGGGGSYFRVRVPLASLPATVTVVVGVGGLGGPAVTAASGNGNDGSPGGSSSFGDLFVANGGLGGRGGVLDGNADGGNGGSVNSSSANGSSNWAPELGGTGGGNSQQPKSAFWGGGGGGKGDASDFQSPQQGAHSIEGGAGGPGGGGYRYNSSTGVPDIRPGLPGTRGGYGTPGTAGTDSSPNGGDATGLCSGGSGYPISTGDNRNAGDGGNGDISGGGAGGAGQRNAGYRSGKGGNGGRGFVRVTVS